MVLSGGGWVCCARFSPLVLKLMTVADRCSRTHYLVEICNVDGPVVTAVLMTKGGRSGRSTAPAQEAATHS